MFISTRLTLQSPWEFGGVCTQSHVYLNRLLHLRAHIVAKTPPLQVGDLEQKNEFVFRRVGLSNSWPLEFTCASAKSIGTVVDKARNAFIGCNESDHAASRVVSQALAM